MLQRSVGWIRKKIYFFVVAINTPSPYLSHLPNNNAFRANFYNVTNDTTDKFDVDDAQAQTHQIVIHYTSLSSKKLICMYLSNQKNLNSQQQPPSRNPL